MVSAARARLDPRTRRTLRFELNDRVADIHAVQAIDAGVLCDVETLGGNHAGDDGTVAFAGADAEGDAVMGAGASG